MCFVVHFLYLLCQCGLRVVIWSIIDILIPPLAAEPYSTAGHLYLTQYLNGTIMVTWSVFNGVGLVGFKCRVNASL